MDSGSPHSQASADLDHEVFCFPIWDRSHRPLLEAHSSRPKKAGTEGRAPRPCCSDCEVPPGATHQASASWPAALLPSSSVRTIAEREHLVYTRCKTNVLPKLTKEQIQMSLYANKVPLEVLRKSHLCKWNCGLTLHLGVMGNV